MFSLSFICLLREISLKLINVLYRLQIHVFKPAGCLRVGVNNLHFFSEGVLHSNTFVILLAHISTVVAKLGFCRRFEIDLFYLRNML